jgi:hypothetical protein
MINENKHGITTLHGFIVPSMPIDVAIVGLQASHSYYPTLTHVNPLVTMATICNTLKCLPNIAYHLQEVEPTHGYYLLFVIIPFGLQTFDLQVFPLFLLP